MDVHVEFVALQAAAGSLILRLRIMQTETRPSLDPYGKELSIRFKMGAFEKEKPRHFG